MSAAPPPCPPFSRARRADAHPLRAGTGRVVPYRNDWAKFLVTKASSNCHSLTRHFVSVGNGRACDCVKERHWVFSRVSRRSARHRRRARSRGLSARSVNGIGVPTNAVRLEQRTVRSRGVFVIEVWRRFGERKGTTRARTRTGRGDHEQEPRIGGDQQARDEQGGRGGLVERRRAERFRVGGPSRTRTGTILRSRDFKSPASAIPPRGHSFFRPFSRPFAARLQGFRSQNRRRRLSLDRL